jgi:YVTN family beta-propeller protein
LFVTLAVLCLSRSYARQALHRVQEIALPHVEGRIDHMDADPQNRRLYVAALGNNSVEVVDLNQRRVTGSIRDLEEPQGLCYLPASDRIAVANGGDGTVRLFEGRTLAEIARIKLSGDADNVRSDSSRSRIYVGYGDGALGIIDASTFKELGSIALPGHPESFELDPENSRFYVNVPSAKQILVLDAAARTRVSSAGLGDASGNFPMALAKDLHLLFAGCRNPSRLLVLDTRSQHILSMVDIVGDVDDVFYDSKHRCLYLSCGSGFLDVVTENGSKEFTLTARIKTAPGARTSLFVPQMNRFYLAVPHRGDQEAAVWVYDVKP